MLALGRGVELQICSQNKYKKMHVTNVHQPCHKVVISTLVWKESTLLLLHKRYKGLIDSSLDETSVEVK